MFPVGTSPGMALSALAVCAAMSATSLHAEDIFQSGSVTLGNTWNNPSFWGGNTPTLGNNYYTAPFGNVETQFTVNETAWTNQGNMRDSVSSSVFGGSKLYINPNTRLLSKANALAETIVDLVLNGGFISSAADTSGGATLSGSIELAAPVGAIGLRPNGAGDFIWTINSTITGSGTLQLATYDVGAGRRGYLHLDGDLSAFTGTFYVAVGTTAAVSAGNSFFSINSSAPLAKVQIMPDSSNQFFYELNSNVTFAGFSIGEMVLGPGTYTFSQLDAIAPGKFFDNGGSITVAPVPEPSAATWHWLRAWERPDLFSIAGIGACGG